MCVVLAGKVVPEHAAQSYANFFTNNELYRGDSSTLHMLRYAHRSIQTELNVVQWYRCVYYCDTDRSTLKGAFEGAFSSYGLFCTAPWL